MVLRRKGRFRIDRLLQINLPSELWVERHSSDPVRGNFRNSSSIVDMRRDPNSTVASKIHGKNDMVFSALKTFCINAAVGATTYEVGMVYKRLEAQGRREILDDCSGLRVMAIRSSPVIAKIRHVDRDIDFPTLRISRFLKGLIYGEKTGKAEQRSP